MELWEACRSYTNAGNGRAVRNVYERVQRMQATRLYETGQTGLNALITILPKDIPSAEDIFY